MKISKDKNRAIVLMSSCLLLSSLLFPLNVTAQQPIMIGIGDSIGEGVQGGDAAWQTQVFSYLNIINLMLGTDLSLPYINTGLFGVVGDTSNRSRIYPDSPGTNVAVSGATVNSLLTERPAANTVAEITTEAELVMFPRKQTQIEFVESNPPVVVFCWIGNNDVLSAATSFGGLNATQMTSPAAFEQSFISLANRLGALSQSHNTLTVFANIPNVTDIGFLVDRTTAEAITGFPVALSDGHYTTIIGALLMSFAGDDSLILDPGFVLDPTELAQIQQRITLFNSVIQREANRINMPLVDINTRFAELKIQPPVYFGKTLNTNILGGLFSLDGVHPSNFGHALIANEFIKTINQSYNTNFPELNQEILDSVYLTDPSIDKDGDGQSTGRFGVGIVETLALIFGVTGDSDDLTPN